MDSLTERKKAELTIDFSELLVSTNSCSPKLETRATVEYFMLYLTFQTKYWVHSCEWEMISYLNLHGCCHSDLGVVPFFTVSGAAPGVALFFSSCATSDTHKVCLGEFVKDEILQNNNNINELIYPYFVMALKKCISARRSLGIQIWSNHTLQFISYLSSAFWLRTVNLYITWALNMLCT